MNVLLLGEDYDAVSGSVVVTVKPAALEELEEGEHTVTVSFDDGSAAVTVTIMALPIVPATGENSRLTYPISMMALSLLAMGLLVLKRKVQGQLN